MERGNKTQYVEAEPKTVLVTGACGFTGTHMTEYLAERGYNVIATDLRKSDRKTYYTEKGKFHPVHYEDFVKELGVEFIAADLTDENSLKPIFENHRIDTVFNVASLYDYFAGWDELYKVNVRGARNIAKLAVKHGVKRFIHWSTEGVYGETGKEPVSEDAPYNPPNLYSKSKVQQEKVLWKMHEEDGLPLTIIRPGPMYGPRHKYGVYQVVAGIKQLGKVCRRLPIPTLPEKDQFLFPSVHVDDVVGAAHFLSEKDEAIGEAYNVVSKCIPEPDVFESIADELGIPHYRVRMYRKPYKAVCVVGIHVAKLIDKIARWMGTRPTIDVPGMEYSLEMCNFSTQKIKDLGFEFKYEDPRPGLKQYIDWCKEEGLV